MKTLTGMLSALLVLGLSVVPAQAAEAKEPAALAITHVTVWDGTGAAAMPDATVVIDKGAVRAVGPAAKVKIPRGAQVVDGTGKFLIPGLWDMHVHWYDRARLPLFTANGVTGIRIMFGAPMHRAWRGASGAGPWPEPRVVLAGPIVDGPKPIWDHSIAVGTPDQGRAAVDKVVADGYDFVKVYSLLPRDAWFAIAQQAKQKKIPFAGHVPISVSILEASNAGQLSCEHLNGIFIACSSKEAELRAEMAARPADAPFDPAFFRRITDESVATYDGKKAAALFEVLRRNGTWQVPTLTVLQSMASLDDPKVAQDSRLRYMPEGFAQMWDPKNDFRLQGRKAADWAHERALVKRQMDLVRAMHKAGVPFLAGTDVLNPYCFPGFSLHDELALLVEAGLSPADALQAATRNVGRYLNRGDIGVVQVGSVADLVLLDADPLADIRNTQRIAAVVRNGRYLPRADLDAMLKAAEANAAGQSK